MGRKHVRPGKYFCIFVAVLIPCLLGGCANLIRSPEEAGPATEITQKKEQAKIHLIHGKRLFFQGDFEGSSRETNLVISLLGERPPADEAFFYRALIFASPGNPNKDYNRALNIMTRIVEEYPQSPFADRARTWTGVISENIRLANEHEDLKKGYERLHKENEKLHKDNEKLIKSQEKLNKENEKLSKMLEEYKRVDIEVEEKMREKGK
jgi:outer membrane protein assembly factor BamD (BamD/ComL family)